MTDQRDQDGTPKTADELWAQRRGKNLVLLSAIIALCVLFFVITIVRMS